MPSSLSNQVNAHRPKQFNIMKYLRAGRRAMLVLVAVMLLVYFVSAQGQLRAGYALFRPDTGSRTPVGSALFTFTNASGVLVSQAGVAPVESIRAGRIFVDESGTKTGLALVNNSSSAATATFILRNSAGIEIARQSLSLGSAHHLARFVSELFPGQAAGLRGSLTFQSDQPLAGVTLRESRNKQDEPLYTTLPVVDLAAVPSMQPVVFPHIAAGGGYTTQLLLMNRGAVPVSGEVRLYASDGQPLSLLSGGLAVSQIPYEIEGDGIFRAEFDAPTLGVGWATAIPASGSRAPDGSAIFQFRSNGQVVTEAGVAATAATTSARIFVDNAGSLTGVAIANPSTSPADLTLTLMDRNGNVEATVNRTLAAGNHVAVFANELFSGVTEGFTGVMQIMSTAAVAPITLKLTTNTRGDFILTTLPVADLMRVSSEASLTFPQIAIGGGFSTRLIFINADTTTAISGSLSFYQSDSAAMVVPLGSEVGSQFLYRISAGGGRQLYPGNTARVSAIILVDPSTNTETHELAVNEGNAVRPRVRVVDGTGQSRDDFDVSYTPSNPNVAVVNDDGSIAGLRAGFSTLTVMAAGVVTTGTLTVVRVDAGPAGFEVVGVAQDTARRLYLASSLEHTILLAQNMRQTPATYAGISHLPGLKNDLRLQSQFRSPAFLAFDQSEGSLYVTDSANNVIRRVRPGTSGRVETLAGTGSPGTSDGPLQVASFNSPQGIALDLRGNLWVVDSGNHTIRRINLILGTVETVAGESGVPGLADGARSAAQFRSPMGIAIEAESTVQQLERERRGDPPPAVSVIVADTGNGVLRRVKENGEVETLRAAGPRAVTLQALKSSQITVGEPLKFDGPTGVIVDALANIYVTEPAAGRVRVVLQGQGAVVPATQANTFRGPRGLSATESGRLVVADSGFAARELSYGAPQIESVSPGRLNDRGGERVMIRGRNFAPDSVVVISGVVVRAAEIQNTEAILFTAPPAGSGRTTITVQNRAGLGQAPVLVDPPPLTALPLGYVTTVAGGTTYEGDGGPATSARLVVASGVAIDSSGAVYIAEYSSHRIRRVDPRSGIINTVAGTGAPGFSGDNGLATAAQLDKPWAITIDPAGNIFFSEWGNLRIRRVDAVTGIITTVAGDGTPGFGLPSGGGDGGPATSAQFSLVGDIAIDFAGNLYICDSGKHRIRKVDARTKIITTIAGTGEYGFSGENGSATSARLGFPDGIAVDPTGNVYIAEQSNQRIRRIEAGSGIIRTVAGTGVEGSSGDGGLATAATLTNPGDLSIDSSGNLYIAGLTARIRKLNPTTGIITTVAGGGALPPSILETIPATSAGIGSAQGIAVDAAGNLFIGGGNRVYRVAATTDLLSTFAGAVAEGSVGDDEPATAATLNQPSGVAVDAQGNLLIADTANRRLRRVDARTRVITTIAGTSSTPIGSPYAIALDQAGNIYFSQWSPFLVRKLNVATGALATAAGNGAQGQAVDGGQATGGPLGVPTGVAVDGAGNLYFADSALNRVRRVSTAGTITTYAGNGTARFGGDGGPATSASLNAPSGLAIDAAGNLYIADNGNGRIRKVTQSTGIITTYVGPETPTVENMMATTLSISPAGISFDSAGNLFVLSVFRNRIDRIDTAIQVRLITRGNLRLGYSGDNGLVADARFNVSAVSPPGAITVDAQGNIFIADTNNNRIRAIKGPLR
ncbi:MAG: SMP-30/gluconolactonase/LRE family protein [Acidobacteria bacterium]|nr:SMP-30/gluconolactonase/LRE family protein [Acidobacteriota bacterium]